MEEQVACYWSNTTPKSKTIINYNMRYLLLRKKLLTRLPIQQHLFQLELKDKVIKWLVHLPRQMTTKMWMSQLHQLLGITSLSISTSNLPIFRIPSWRMSKIKLSCLLGWIAISIKAKISLWWASIAILEIVSNLPLQNSTENSSISYRNSKDKNPSLATN